jgi:hypothetical protein
MSWDVENTDEFASWFVDLSEADQDAIRFTVGLLISQRAQPTLSPLIGDQQFAACAYA